MPVPANPADAAPTLAELTFPASDPLAGTPEEGMQLDPGVLHQAAPPSPAVRQFMLDGLQAAWAMEAAQSWVPALGAAVAAPGLRGGLDRLKDDAFRPEQVQRALAAFGISHPAPSPSGVGQPQEVRP